MVVPSSSDETTQPFQNEIDALETKKEDPQHEASTEIEVPKQGSTLLQMLMSQENNSNAGATAYASPRGASLERESPTAQIVLPKERYRIQKNLSISSFFVLQQAYDHWLNREVWIKKLREDIHFSPQQYLDAQWQLQREYEITASLEHPNILSLQDVQPTKKESFFFTLQKVEGHTLALHFQEQKLGTRSIFEESEWLNIFFKICDAVAYAHANEIVHRNILPEHLLLGEFGVVYLFGWENAGRKNETEENQLWTKKIANLFSFSSVYGAPEQLQDPLSVNVRTDVYALGKILREGFLRLSPEEELDWMKNAHSKKQLISWISERIPLDIQFIIQKSVEEKWQKRYPSVEEMVLDLKQYQKNLKVSSRHYHWSELFQKWKQRHQKKIYGILFSFFCCILLFLLFWWNERQQKIATIQEALKEGQHFWKMAQEEDQSDEEKIQNLLTAFQFYQSALEQQPSLRLEKERDQIGKEIIARSYKLSNYSVAQHIAEELQQSIALSSQEKENLLLRVKQEQEKKLTQHQLRLQQWVRQLKSIRQSSDVREEAILELAAMPEPEIFEELVLLLKEGKEYWLSETAHQKRLDDFYEIILFVFRYSTHPQARSVLFQHLESLSENWSVRPDLSERNQQHLLSLFRLLFEVQNTSEERKHLSKIQDRFKNYPELFDKIKIILSSNPQ